MNYAKIILLSLILNYCPIQAHRQPWYLNIIQKTSLSYVNKCSLIKAIQAVKKASLLTNNLISTKTYQEIKNDIIQKQLNIKNRYLKKEQQILNILGKSLGFSKKQWGECLHTINHIKKIASKQLTQKKTSHDPAIPEKLMTLITSLLIKNGIDPNSINLIYTTADNPQIFAATLSSLAYSYDPKNIQCIHNSQLTQKIIFYDQITNQTEANQLALCAHEVEHLCQQHGIISIIIEQYMKHYLNKERDFAKQNKKFHPLEIIHEAQAEIFAALKDSDVAQALVDMRAQKYYPYHLYEAHYHDLVEINNLWKMEQLVDRLHSLF